MTAQTDEAKTVRPIKAQTYVPGSHAARVRTEHDERRTELLARDEVLAAEIAISLPRLVNPSQLVVFSAISTP